MKRSEYELAIVATELNGIMEKLRKRKTPQLRAMLQQSKATHGEISMGYAAMRRLIVDVGEQFDQRRENDAPVTAEPGPAPVDTERARKDFA